MTETLRDIPVLALDCQAGGANPAHGDLLELGWAVCAAGELGPVRSRWIVPRTDRRVPRAVRELTGWSEACIDEAVDERTVWAELEEDVGRIVTGTARASAPTVIHFARFELPFLRDLHQRIGERADFPFDTICLHAIASRLFPDLPRRNIRALAGHLGHSPGLVRRCAGHVEATAFIWRALVPLLEQAGIRSWGELGAWLEQAVPIPRRERRVYPLAIERRRALPDRPGVYRFLRPNRDVLYVGKATSLRKRVAGHFKIRGPGTERALELLTQVDDIDSTETASLLEAALLESDEIKRLDPPYNVQLRTHDRSAWFASSDLREAVSAPDALHRIGPLPSQRALSALWALNALLEGSDSPQLRAVALAVPATLLPDEALFIEGWRGFQLDHLEPNLGATAARRIQLASRALWLERGRSELDAPEESAPDVWDVARVRRRVERNLIQAGLVFRRARWLCLLADADVAFREPGMAAARALVLSRGEIVERRELDSVIAIAQLPARRPRALHERQRSFDAAAYDRVRVLATELRRIHDDGGEVAVRVGKHLFSGMRLATLMRGV